MHTLEQLREKIEQKLAAIDYPKNPAHLYEPIRYTLDSGGKRIRPILLLGTYQWLSNEESLASAMPAAMAIEVFHNFTLLHDDIMDRSSLRRNRPTVNAKWNDNVAILSGDAMGITAYTLLSTVPSDKMKDVLQRFNFAALRVCEGQQYDMQFERQRETSLREYLLMIEYKTAALLEGSVRIGAVLGRAEKQVEEELAKFARELGIAFQLQDDLLDTYGNTSTFGKQVGDDIAANKQTMLSIMAWTQADRTQKARLQELYEDRSISRQEKYAAVKSIFDTLGVRELAEKQIAERQHLSLESLEQVETTLDREATVLRGVWASLLRRNY